MKTKLRIILLSTFAGLLVWLLIQFVLPDGEPFYKGHPLCYWVVQLSSDRPRRDPTVLKALRQMGQPAIDRLTWLLEHGDSAHPDSRFEKQLARHMGQNSHVGEFPVWTAQQYYAARALGSLGSAAKSAIPALERMTASAGDSTVQIPARAALILIRKDSITEYVRTYADHDNTNSGYARALLAEVGPAASEMIPLLLKELESTNSQTQYRAIGLLSCVGVESSDVVPVLAKFISSGNVKLRESAIFGLSAFGPLAKPVITQVAAELKSPQQSTRAAAMIFISRAVNREEFKSVLPAVEFATGDSDPLVRELATAVLDRNEK
ncbi:MAG: hypothetical protein EXS35_01545 [Pedosphaera sp.]|nr:hypothetical protein [Pedosphaera sp.]